MNKTLTQLNQLFGFLGTWRAVADEIGYNRATVNKWFSGKRFPSAETREWINQVHRIWA
jgi:transcriptional regulator with XRE-family HTH domain